MKNENSQVSRDYIVQYMSSSILDQLNYLQVVTKRTIRVNLVGLHGLCFEGDKKMLVYDYIPHDSSNSWKMRHQNVLGSRE